MRPNPDGDVRPVPTDRDPRVASGAPPLPPDPRRDADERTASSQFLDHQRAVLVREAAGLTSELLAATTSASSLTLGQLLRHLTFVEHDGFEVVFAGRDPAEPWASADWEADRDWEMTSASGMTFDELRADLDAAIDASRAVVAEAPSLDATSSGRRHEGGRHRARRRRGRAVQLA